MKVGDLIQHKKTGRIALVTKTFVASKLIHILWVGHAEHKQNYGAIPDFLTFP
tara:strand:+ start:228 stop:386 length:159 start_codon:yes stop_codon:yes gene_type:complete